MIGYELTPEQVARVLRDIQHDVEHGTWRPPAQIAAAAVVRDDNPTFHAFSSDWLADQRSEEYEPRTIEFFQWALTHLLGRLARPTGRGTWSLADIQMRDLTLDHVDAYRKAKLLELWPRAETPLEYMRKGKLVRGKVGARAGKKRLSACSVNRTIEVLALICEVGLDRRFYPGNPAAGKRRKAKTAKRDPVGSWLDYDQCVAMLDAAHLLDTVPYKTLRERYGDRTPRVRGLNQGRRGLLASMYLSGDRVSESCGLQRLHVSWEGASLRVADAKTETG